MRRWGHVVHEAFRHHGRDGVPFYAAALGFYTLLAVVPLFALVLLVAGAGAESWLFQGTDATLGNEHGDALKTLIGEASPDAVVGWRIVGVAALFLFAATRVLATLEAALDRIWDVEPDPSRNWWSLVRKRVLSFASLVSVSLVLVVSLAGGALLAALVPAWEAGRVVLQGLLAFGVVSLAYKVLPDAETEWRDVGPAAAWTATVLAVGERAVAFVLSLDSSDAVYGSTAGVIVAMLWFYSTSWALLFGAELAHASARERGGAPAPEPIARRRGEKEDRATPQPSSGAGPSQAVRRRRGRGRERSG